jgi:hypothetical protein
MGWERGKRARGAVVLRNPAPGAIGASLIAPYGLQACRTALLRSHAVQILKQSQFDT